MNNVKKYFKTENHPGIKTRNQHMYTFGSTCFASKSPLWRYKSKPDEYKRIPRLLKNCRDPGTQGYELLHDKSFIQFAQEMDDYVHKFIEIQKSKNNEKGLYLEKCYSRGKQFIPEELRIGDTCFTLFAILGNDK
jgi:hypothetical protein